MNSKNDYCYGCRSVIGEENYRVRERKKKAVLKQEGDITLRSHKRDYTSRVFMTGCFFFPNPASICYWDNVLYTTWESK